MGTARLTLKMTRRLRDSASFSGSRKASRQLALQKKYLRPSTSAESPLASSTYIPQIGSLAKPGLPPGRERAGPS